MTDFGVSQKTLELLLNGIDVYVRDENGNDGGIRQGVLQVGGIFVFSRG
jgi:hypothetical protein